jgi:hypothetical protein
MLRLRILRRVGDKLNDGHKACLKADPFYEEKFVPAFLYLKCGGSSYSSPSGRTVLVFNTKCSLPGATVLVFKTRCFSRRAVDDTISPTSVFPSSHSFPDGTRVLVFDTGCSFPAGNKQHHVANFRLPFGFPLPFLPFIISTFSCYLLTLNLEDLIDYYAQCQFLRRLEPYGLVIILYCMDNFKLF